MARREADRAPGAGEALLQEAAAADDRGGDALDARRGPLPRARLLRSALGAGDAPGLRQPARVVALDRRLHHGRRHAGHDVAVGGRAAGGGGRAWPGAGAGRGRRTGPAPPARPPPAAPLPPTPPGGAGTLTPPCGLRATG